MTTKRRIPLSLPHFVLNPAASAGSLGRNQSALLGSLEKYFPEGFTLDVTSRPGHATDISRRALAAGTRLLVAVGGDGTMNEVINGFFDRGKLVSKKARMGFLCVGTAKDVVRNLGLPPDLDSQLRFLRDPGSRTIDLGHVTCSTENGTRVGRFFLNDCQPGIAATVVKRVTPALKRLGGFLAFGIGSTLTALTYRARPMSVSTNGRHWMSGTFLGVTVANGRFAGGGMDFAPASKIHDGLLDVLVIRDQPILSRLVNFPRIYSGKHVSLPWIEYRQARSITVTSPERVALEADGELIGVLPCEIRVLPRAFTVAVPRSNAAPSGRSLIRWLP